MLALGRGPQVLDMCAAPGSKTFQLLEALHAGPEPPTGADHLGRCRVLPGCCLARLGREPGRAEEGRACCSGAGGAGRA